MKRRYTVIIIQGEDEGFSALAPDGIALGIGDTLDEARADVRAALEDVIDSYLEDDVPIPESRTTLAAARMEFPEAIIETVEVDVPDPQSRYLGIRA
jgi:predicted RNase H-like HicB family nuclease